MSYLGVKVSSVAPCDGQQEHAMDAAELKGLLVMVKGLPLDQRAELLAALGTDGDDTQVRLQMPDLPAQLQRTEHHTAGQVAHEGGRARWASLINAERAAVRQCFRPTSNTFFRNDKWKRRDATKMKKPPSR